MHPVPRIYESNKILGSLTKMKCYPTVISFSKQMEMKGIHHSHVTLSILINCFCHLSQMTFAFSIFGKIFKLGYHPNVVTLTTLMRGLCTNGEVRKALNFHDKMVAQGFRFDEVCYGTLIRGLCDIGETKAAIQLLGIIEARSTKYSPSIQIWTCK